MVCEDVKTAKFWLAVLAEFIGTGLLVLVGCGSCAKGEVVRISLAFGFTGATIVWIFEHVSGALINPAVTVGFLVTRKITFIRALLYVVAQILGALAGAGILKAVNASASDNLCTPVPGPGITVLETFFIELLIAFVLILTVFATCDSLRGFSGSGPLAIGLAISMCHLWAVPFTGSSMNPARAFGPAVVSGYLRADKLGIQAMYWLGPLLGAVIAALLYDCLFATNSSLEKAKSLVSKRDYDVSKFDKEGRRSSDSGQHLTLTDKPAAEPDYGTLH